MKNSKVLNVLIAIIIVFGIGCKHEANHVIEIKLTRNKNVKNHLEANFSVNKDDKYFISLWDRNNNNNFQDFEIDALSLRNEKNRLFINNFLKDSCLIIFNNRSFYLDFINDSLLTLNPTFNDSILNQSNFIINDTISNVVLHHFNNDSTALLYDIVTRADCDSILIYIWETQCPPCRSDIDKFNRIESNNLKIIHLCFNDNAEDAYELMSKKSYRPFFDGYIDVLDKRKVYCIGFPTKFYINRNNYIIKYLF